MVLGAKKVFGTPISRCPVYLASINSYIARRSRTNPLMGSLYSYIMRALSVPTLGVLEKGERRSRRSCSPRGEPPIPREADPSRGAGTPPLSLVASSFFLSVAHARQLPQKADRLTQVFHLSRQIERRSSDPHGIRTLAGRMSARNS